MSLVAIRSRLKELANPQSAKILQGFFKTGPGQYGEGDVFIGIKIPPLRKVAREFQDASRDTVKPLLQSPIHEERTLALMILTRAFEKGEDARRKEIYTFYVEHLAFINNWDLVDGSAPYIVGPYLWKRDRAVLYKWVKSRSLWERRIAILSTFYFIRQKEFADALKLSAILLREEHDLIHKAVGWMLREIGKRDIDVEETFLREHCREMPRTMLRYAIEKFPEDKRRMYLRGDLA